MAISLNMIITKGKRISSISVKNITFKWMGLLINLGDSNTILINRITKINCASIAKKESCQTLWITMDGCLNSLSLWETKEIKQQDLSKIGIETLVSALHTLRLWVSKRLWVSFAQIQLLSARTPKSPAIYSLKKQRFEGIGIKWPPLFLRDLSQQMLEVAEKEVINFEIPQIVSDYLEATKLLRNGTLDWLLAIL